MTEHDKNTAALRSRIGQTSSMLGQFKEQGDTITNGATARLKQVTDHIEQLRGKVILDPVAADEYLELIKEKGALLRTLQN